jgi:hypothetical protein
VEIEKYPEVLGKKYKYYELLSVKYTAKLREKYPDPEKSNI